MTNKLNIPLDYPIEHLTPNYDIVSLVKNKEWDKLNSIPICKDKENNIISKFIDTKWSLNLTFQKIISGNINSILNNSNHHLH